MSASYPIDHKQKKSSKSEEYFQYAEVYKHAIVSLLEEFSKNPPIHDYSLAPVLYMLRQYIELQLKGIIAYDKINPKPRKTHDVWFLYNEALKNVQERYGIGGFKKPDLEVLQFIESIANFDKNGEAFRYPETSKGEGFAPIEAIFLHSIASDLSDLANKIIGHLENIEGYLDCMYENEQEGWANQ